jgi:hypothetical protein
MELEGVDWTHLTEDRNCRLDHNTVIKHRIPFKVEYVLTV